MEIQLNEELIKRVNNQSMFERGTGIQNVANSLYLDFVTKFENNSYNDEQKKVFENRKKSLKEFIEKSYNEYLSIASRFVPVTVAGPSNYPIKKQQNILDKMMNKEKEIFEKVEKFNINTEKMLKEKILDEELIKKYRNGYNEPISSDDPKVREKLQAKLEYFQEKHQQYKDYNKKARLNNEKQLPLYVLSNSNQNIKSIKNRLDTLDKVNNFDEVGYYFSEGEVRFDKTDSRVKIFFDSIPSSDIRDTLKTNGYKWSPKNKAWQRKLTPQAISRTKYLFKDIGSLEIKKVNDYTEDKSITM